MATPRPRRRITKPQKGVTKAAPYKVFERAVREQMDRAGLQLVGRLYDPLEPTGDPKFPFRKAGDVNPADFYAQVPETGGLVLVEVKMISQGRSVACERSQAEELRRRNKSRVWNPKTQRMQSRSSFGGVQFHQADSLVKAHNTPHGFGILVVGFSRHGVRMLDGHGLRLWMEQGDSEEGVDRKSISLEHFDEFGWELGSVEHGWAFPYGFFQSKKGP